MVRTVGIFLMPNYEGIALSGLIDPMVWANRYFNRREYRFSIISYDGTPVRGWSRQEMKAQYSIGDTPDLDDLIILGEASMLDLAERQLFAWWRSQMRRKVRIWAIGSAIMVCARAGIFDGHSCCAPWSQITSLHENFPNVEANGNLYCIDDDRISCAGATATLDVMLTVLKEDHGEDVSQRCANYFNHHKIRRPDESVRMPHDLAVNYPNAWVQKAIDIINAEPKSLSPPELVERVGISRRQLERLFATHVGKTMLEYLNETQVWRAYDLLFNTSLSVTEISYAVGFSNPSLFAKKFRRQFGDTPGNLRRRKVLG